MKLSKTQRYRSYGRLVAALALSFSVLMPFSGMQASSNVDGQGPAEVHQDASITVKGKVVDNFNEPLIGVSVTVVGTQNRTVTDLDGNYTISAPSKTKITFSYVGFKNITVDAKASLDVQMSEDSKALSEVVVVGYGTMKKENLTGAVVSVDLDKAVGSRPIADIGRGLQGVAPGLQVSLPSTEIGSEPKMSIRGTIGSISGGSSPLILLDNVEIPSIQLVNPDDIASISVLKDAASTSIYGAKGTFGVVLITTKQGSKEDRFDIQYSNNLSWQTVDKTIKLAGIDGIEYALDALERSGGSTFIGAFFKVNRESLERSRNWMQNYGGTIGANDPMVYGRDWYRQGGYNFGVRIYNPADYMVKDWAFSQNHNLSVGGTVGKTNYNVSLGLLDQNSMLKPAKQDDFKRHNANIRLSSELNKYITVRASTLYSNRNKRSPFTGGYTADPWYYMYRWTPVMPYGLDEYGDPMRTPAYEMAAGHTAERENAYANVSLGATINLTSNWDLVADYTYARNDYTYTMPGTRFLGTDIWGQNGLSPRKDGFGNDVFVNEHGQVVPNDPTNPMITQAYDFKYLQYNAGGAADKYGREHSQYKQNVWNIYSTYNLKLGEKGVHDFKFMVGTNRVTQDNIWSMVEKKGVLVPSKPEIGQTTGATSSDGTASWEAQIGYFGRVNYAYADKYLLEANFRYDGSSKFPSDRRWKSFPSFSAGWVVTQEKFMESTSNYLSFLKARASWGSLGDQSVPAGKYLPLMEKTLLAWLDASGQKVTTYDAAKFVQRNLSWQRLETLDVGVDTRFWNNHIGVSFDWYKKDMKDMITGGAKLPAVVGAASPEGNFATLTTKGWELSMDFNYTFSNGLTVHGGAAVWDAKSKYTKFFDTEERGIYNLYQGKTYGEIWGFKTDRLFTFADFKHKPGTDPKDYSFDTLEKDPITKKYIFADEKMADQSKLEGSSFIFGPGDVKYQDLDGDGIIDYGSNSIDDHGDLTVIGNSTPRYEYSFNLGFDYKGFDFSVYAQGIGKRQMWGEGQLAIPGFQIGDGGMPQAIAGNYWTMDNQDAFYPRAWNMYSDTNGYNFRRQSRYLLDMSYLRIKNITMGYTFNPKWLEKVYMKKARIYMSVENLFTFDNLRGLPIDPETSSNNSGNSMFVNEAAGVKYNAGRTGNGAPAFKTVSFGLQVNF